MDYMMTAHPEGHRLMVYDHPSSPRMNTGEQACLSSPGGWRGGADDDNSIMFQESSPTRNIRLPFVALWSPVKTAVTSPKKKHAMV